MVKKSKEIWKIYKNVFDQFTLRTIFKLQSQKVIEGLDSPIEIGKEANVFTALDPDGSKLIVKIYRLESSNFNKMYDYIKKDARYVNLKKRKREIIFSWVQREYRNLMIAREAGVRVPTPMAFTNNVLVLEFIGDKTPAPQLKDSVPEDMDAFVEDLTKNLIKLDKAGLVHGDLSGFNILNLNDKPVLIDFSQGTMTKSPNANELLERDIKNVCNFFRKYGKEIDEKELILRIKNH